MQLPQKFAVIDLTIKSSTQFYDFFSRITVHFTSLTVHFRIFCKNYNDKVNGYNFTKLTRMKRK